MLKIIPISLAVCLLSATVHAADSTSEQMMRAEFDQNKSKINEIFQDKVQKISARPALPEKMRSLLISQADEIRQFDLDMLQKKMNIKIRQAKQRDEMKERLRQDAQNRAKWLLEDEEKFQENKKDREQKERAILNQVQDIQQEAENKKLKK
ncbi:MAG: hypothetical protein J5787_03695 [Alphaproteobacteria bacterium]|nr:hypothetical protein [Alphaproteobacteria bacterium]MBO4643937.1 hypothetical protein [Alphaproteobacteria bacterium]